MPTRSLTVLVGPRFRDAGSYPTIGRGRTSRPHAMLLPNYNPPVYPPTVTHHRAALSNLIVTGASPLLPSLLLARFLGSRSLLDFSVLEQMKLVGVLDVHAGRGLQRDVRARRARVVDALSRQEVSDRK